MPSARRQAQLTVFVLCGVLATAGLTGCETTQEKAAAQRTESARILKAREKRHHKKGER